MVISNSQRKKHLSRLAALLKEGEALKRTARKVTGRTRTQDMFTGEVLSRDPDYEVVDYPLFIEWTTKCGAALHQIIPANHPDQALVGEFREAKAGRMSALNYFIARLMAIRDSYRQGFYQDMRILISAEIAGDYISQAVVLLEQGYYVPAAVLGGAVLEDALRRLCVVHDIGLETEKGKPKTIDPLNTDLVKASVYNSAKAQEIRGWAALRNAAAHGEGSSIDAKAVERMIAGVQAFVSDYVR